MILNIFYKEPENDRWIKYDRFPRKIMRNILRGKPSIGGVQIWFENLKAGLDIIKQPYRVNDFNYIKKNPNEVAFVIGKGFLVNSFPDQTPIVHGPGVESHPDASEFWGVKNIIHLIISCQWLKELYDRDLPFPIDSSIWPAGIDSEEWMPSTKEKDTIIIYDKVRWERDILEPELINPIIQELKSRGRKIEIIKYGFYKEEDFKESLKNASGMIFLCEHETQGFAYLQTLSCDVPIFAWDRVGYWKDPKYYPEVKFKDVTSVPYWDEKCGIKFSDLNEFQERLDDFLDKMDHKVFSPRQYVIENLSLEDKAKDFVKIAETIISKHEKKIK